MGGQTIDSDAVTASGLYFEMLRIHGLRHDPWGVAMGALFATCDYMTERGLDIPDAFGFRQAMGGADTDAYEYQTLVELNPTDDELTRFANVLHRYISLLKRHGKDY